MKHESKLKHILRRLPIETYVVFVMGMSTFLLVLILDAIYHKWGFQFDPSLVLMGPMAGAGMLRYNSIALFCYGAVLLFAYLFTRSREGLRGVKKATKDEKFFRVGRSVMYWFIVSSSIVFGSAAMFRVLFQSFTYDEMASASDTLMHWDHMLFGVYPPFFLHTLGLPGFVQLLLANAYVYTPGILAAALTYVFCAKREVFRMCFLALAISTMISLPCWIMFPAIPVNEMYRLNLLKKELTPEMGVEVSHVSFIPSIANMLDEIERMWIDENAKSFSVSEFPSTHVIWATVALYALFTIRRWLGAVMLPWYVANFFSTMFLLEHYAVDAIAGILMGALAIFLARYLLRFEKSYFVDEYGLLSIFEVMKFPGALKDTIVSYRATKDEPAGHTRTRS